MSERPERPPQMLCICATFRGFRGRSADALSWPSFRSFAVQLARCPVAKHQHKSPSTSHQVHNMPSCKSAYCGATFPAPGVLRPLELQNATSTTNSPRSPQCGPGRTIHRSHCIEVWGEPKNGCRMECRVLQSNQAGLVASFCRTQPTSEH